MAKGWDFYYLHSLKKKEKIIKTGLYLEREKGGRQITAYLKYGDKRLKGSAEIIQEDPILIIHLTQNTNDINDRIRIYLAFPLPSKVDKTIEDNWLLNGSGVITGGRNPVALGHAVISKSDVTHKNITLREPENTVKVGNSFLEDQIIAFLLLNRDKGIKLFDSDDEYGIENYNLKMFEKAKRSGYDDLKTIFKKDESLDYGWYSFSRIEPERYGITIFHWDFTFKDEEYKVTVDRRRFKKKGGTHYAGEFFLDDYKLYARLEEKKKRKIISYKSFSTIIKKYSDTQLLGISGTTTYSENKGESRNVAVREILCYLPHTIFSDTNVEDGLLAYDTFVSLMEEKLIDKDKLLYIASRSQSTLSFPSEHNLRKRYARIMEASNFAGNYYILLRDKTCPRKERLMLLTLDIDSLSNVIMNVRYNDGKNAIYFGYAEHYSNNLHIHLETDTNRSDEQKIATFIVNTKSSGSKNIRTDQFSGVAMDTDYNDEAGAYPFVIVKQGILNYAGEAPHIININQIDPHCYMSVLPKFFQENNPQDFFFQLKTIENG